MSGDSDIANIGLGILYGLKATKGSESETWVQEIWEQAITDNWGVSGSTHFPSITTCNVALAENRIETS